MKKFLLYALLVVAILAAAFTYVLYDEGFFDTLHDTPQGELEPFQMKCEAGKCGGTKCDAGKMEVQK